MKSVKRNSWIVAIIGILFPPIAYLWLGSGKWSACLLLIDICLLIFGVYFGGLYIGVAALGITLLLFIFIRIFVLFDVSRRSRIPVMLRWYNQGVYYLIFILVVGLGENGLVEAFRSRFIEFFRIPSSSSSPTILPGDYVAVDKSLYRTHPVRRGDVVTLQHPDGKPSIYMYRVVGLPGEEISLKKTEVLINGKALDEPYARWNEGGRTDGEFDTIKIPAGHYFLLGDNRDQSQDSRFWDHPFVPVENVTGKVIYIYWSWNGFQRIGMQIS